MHVRLSCLRLSFCVLFFPPLPPLHPGYRLSVSFFAFVHFPPAFTRRSMLSYPIDNSIILHAKTASDVLAQSASHLCEQITSYRKTDFIFEKRWFQFFCSLLDPLPRSISRFLVFLFFLLALLCIAYSGGQDWHD